MDTLANINLRRRVGVHTTVGCGTVGRMRDNVLAMLAKLPDGEVIPLPVIGQICGWNRDQRSMAVRSGVVRPLPDRSPGRSRSYQVTRDEARLIIVASVLARAADAAVITMIKAVRGSGLDLAALVGAAT